MAYVPLDISSLNAVYKQMIKHFLLLQDILTETAFNTVSLPNDLITCILKMKTYRYLKLSLLGQDTAWKIRMQFKTPHMFKISY
jgi:hypothetical protein